MRVGRGGNDRHSSARRVAGLLFAALVTLCGIGVHLVAELAGLGWRLDSQLVFSRHHIPLGILAVGAIGALVAVAYTAARQPDRTAFADRIVRALPDGGCGARFLSLAFASQIGVFAVTEAGEGLPVQAGDVSLAIVAAVCAGAIGAVLVLRAQRRIVEAVGRLIVIFIDPAALPRAAQSWKHVEARVRVGRCRSIVFAGSRRPPPAALVIEPFLAFFGSQETAGVHLFISRPCVC
jgi:hypothetical protein